jgi:RimJ/RimL family protein N-acetyltransferase
VLRRWRASDRPPFAALNDDPAVAAQLAGPLTRQQSDEMIANMEDHFGRRGFGRWALQLVTTGEFLGFTGLSVPAFCAPFLPAVEVGWRLAPDAWGQGYATEAARAAVRYGFSELGLAEIISFTAVTNQRSRAVMRRLGMTTNPAEDFDHPGLPVGHPLRRHVLHRLSPPPGAAPSR